MIQTVFKRIDLERLSGLTSVLGIDIDGDDAFVVDGRKNKIVEIAETVRTELSRYFAAIGLINYAQDAQMEKPAKSGVKTRTTANSGLRTIIAALCGCATATQAAKMPSAAYVMTRVGMSGARALPNRNSSRRIGVVSTGSRVPCSRSPITA